jgi:hypothetical protein
MENTRKIFAMTQKERWVWAACNQMERISEREEHDVIDIEVPDGSGRRIAVYLPRGMGHMLHRVDMQMDRTPEDHDKRTRPAPELKPGQVRFRR